MDAVISARVDALMRSTGLYDRARAAVVAFATSRTAAATANGDAPDVIDALREAGVVADLVAALQGAGLGDDVLAALAATDVSALAASAATADGVDTAASHPPSVPWEQRLPAAAPRVPAASARVPSAPARGSGPLQRAKVGTRAAAAPGPRARTRPRADNVEPAPPAERVPAAALPPQPRPITDDGRHYRLVVRLRGGRAFLPHLDDDEAGEATQAADAGGAAGSAVGRGRVYRVCAAVRGQRVDSLPQPAAVAPPFRDVMAFDVTPPPPAAWDGDGDSAGGAGDAQRLLRVAGDGRLHVLLTLSRGCGRSAGGEDDSGDGEVDAPWPAPDGDPPSPSRTVDIVGTAVVDWRLLLAVGSEASRLRDVDGGSGDDGEAAAYGADASGLALDSSPVRARSPAGNNWTRVAAMDTHFTLAHAGGGGDGAQPGGGAALAAPAAAAAASASTAVGPPPIALVSARLEVLVLGDDYDFNFNFIPLPRGDVVARVEAEAASGAAAARAYLAHARVWWASVKALHPRFASRPVKLFAESIRGDSRPTSAFVVPPPQAPCAADVNDSSGGAFAAETLRCLPSPRDAARFVSLLPLRPPGGSGWGAPGGGVVVARDVWQDPFATLARGAFGRPIDAATLLASLLSAQGLDAWVAVGTRPLKPGDTAGTGGAEAVGEECSWVVTRRALPHRAGSAAFLPSPAFAVTLWEPQSGRRWALPSPGAPLAGSAAAVARPLSPAGRARAGHVLTDARVACVFNHAALFACVAADDRAAAVRWDFNVGSGGGLQRGGGGGGGEEWRAVDSALLAPAAAAARPPAPALRPPRLDGVALARRLEAELRGRVAAHRRARAPALNAAAAAAAARIAKEGGPDVVVSDGGDAAATPWDAGLEARLAPALAAYEASARRGGGDSGGEGVDCAEGDESTEDWADALRRALPADAALRAVPLLVNHGDAGRAMRALLTSPAARAVLAAPRVATARRSSGTGARRATAFALRVQAWALAEGVAAVWVMLCVCEPAVVAP